MCGRFVLTADPVAIQSAFDLKTMPAEMTPRYNIAPTQPVAVITNEQPDALTFHRWGLIPSWAKDMSIGARKICPLGPKRSMLAAKRLTRSLPSRRLSNGDAASYRQTATMNGPPMMELKCRSFSTWLTDGFLASQVCGRAGTARMGAKSAPAAS